jgi:hypothetical protein
MSGSVVALPRLREFRSLTGELVPIAGLAVVATVVAAWIVLSSDAGRVLGAMRDNDERCSHLGLDTPSSLDLQIALLCSSAARWWIQDRSMPVPLRGSTNICAREACRARFLSGVIGGKITPEQPFNGCARRLAITPG